MKPADKNEFSSRVAVVTGGTGGIGRETVRTLIAGGAKVAVSDMAMPEADLEAELERSGGRFVQADVTDHGQVESLFADTASTYGRIDILVNCAGISRLTPVLEIKPDEWDRVLSINLKSVFLCSQQALGHMCRQKSGNIVSIASAAGKIGGIAVGAHYAASKAGVICLTKSLVLFGASHGVNVNCVCPGPTATPMTDEWGEKINTAFAEKIPLKRYGTPLEVAEAICFLASGRSSYITGATLDVNGGLVMD